MTIPPKLKISSLDEKTSRVPCVLEDSASSRTWVILVHGLFASRASMRPLEVRLQAQRFSVLNWEYPTLWHATQQHVDRLRAELCKLQSDPQVDSIHFVTHSMGGIIARGALHAGCYHKVRRMVMLAPPNRGSHLTRLSPHAVTWCVPAIADLSEAPDSLPHRLSIPEHIEVGIIAASRDFVVSVANTRLQNQREHCVIPTTHFQLPSNTTVANRVVNFLEQGNFAGVMNATQVNAASAAANVPSDIDKSTSRAA